MATQTIINGYPFLEPEGTAMLPGHLKAEFWQDVERRLEADHRIDGAVARRGIADYLALAEEHGFSDLIYHRDPEDVANTIAGSLAQGGLAKSKTQ
jgi:hypothetical protein